MKSYGQEDNSRETTAVLLASGIFRPHTRLGTNTLVAELLIDQVIAIHLRVGLIIFANDTF